MADISKTGSRPHVEQRELGELSRLPREILDREVLFYVACDGARDLYSLASTCRSARKLVVSASSALIERHDSLERSLLRDASTFKFPRRAVPRPLSLAANSAREFRQLLLPPDFFARVRDYFEGDEAPMEFQIHWPSTLEDTNSWSQDDQSKITSLLKDLRDHCYFQPDDLLGHYLLSFLLLALKRENEIGSALEIAHTLSPQHPGVCYLQGLLALRKGQAAHATCWFELAVENSTGATALDVPASLCFADNMVSIDAPYIVALMQSQREEDAVTRLLRSDRCDLDTIAEEMSYASAFELAALLVRHKPLEADQLISSWWINDLGRMFYDGLSEATYLHKYAHYNEAQQEFAAKLLRLRATLATQLGHHDRARAMLTGLLAWRPQDKLARAALAAI